MKKLITIGYESCTISQFLCGLQKVNVTHLLDIRELPLSRKAGFSKQSLAIGVQQVGIQYAHYKALGAPRHVRNQLRMDRDYDRYFKSFEDYLATQSGLLVELAESLDGVVALMCFERDAAICHRSAVARQLGHLCQLVPEHVRVDLNAAGRYKKSVYSGQSLSSFQPEI